MRYQLRFRSGTFEGSLEVRELAAGEERVLTVTLLAGAELTGLVRELDGTRLRADVAQSR